MLEDSEYVIPEMGDYFGEVQGYRHRPKGGLFVYLKTHDSRQLKLFVPPRFQRAIGFFTRCRIGRRVAVRYDKVVSKFRKFD